MEIDLNIQNKFTQDQKELFSILREVINRYAPSTELYLVGGFVRDLLIKNGPLPDDIDVMLSNISGADFAKLVTKHLNIKDAHVIQENPEKSKWITTAKTHIPLSSGNIQEVDFAQARQEIYKDNSRIPDIKPATPQEDAYRRDLTINSIFYDIKKNQIVDFTGKGIRDLISDTIRTPEDPLKTFSDDPLRIFRVVRFSAKYNGKIDPETYRAMMNPQLRDEIKKKVSKERLGQEFIKMLKNPNPQVAIQLLKDTGLWEDIISEAIKGSPYEGKLAQLDMSQENPHHKLTLWGHTFEVIKHTIEKYKDAEPEKRVVMILAALMHDIGKLYQNVWAESKSHPGHRSYHGHEDESAKLVKLIFQYLKIEPYINEVANLSQQHMRPHQLLRNEGGARALRRFIRTTGELSLNWLDVFNLALSDAYSKDLNIDPATIQEYQQLEAKLQEAMQSLKPISEKSIIKPILNGNEIMQILNIKPSPIMKEITEFVKEMRDDNPEITKEEAIIKLKEKFGYLTPNTPTDSTKTAQSKKEEPKEPSSTCPKHLLEKKIQDINEMKTNNNNYGILTELKQLKDEYGKDEIVNNLIAKNTLELIIKDEELKDQGLMQHIFDKATENFFDPVLVTNALGILILTKTSTEDEVINKVAERMRNMAPKLLKETLLKLPKKVYKQEILNDILRKL